MQLPKATAQWNILLAEFPAEIAAMLEALAVQLRELIGPTAAENALGSLEPDGFSGINRQPHYERLLMSEWVLLTELPDEFMRRAISGEHLFLQPKKIDSTGAYCCKVLFDCGPDQLGMPRVVQLALLILLARRAAKLGMQFYWGVVQNNKTQWEAIVDQHSVSEWLNQRTFQMATQSMLDAWIEVDQVQPSKENTSITLKNANIEYWLISNELFSLGASSIRSSAIGVDADSDVKTPCINTISIKENVFKSGELQVGSSIKGRQRTKTLTAPEADLCTRLIRDPFELKTTTISATATIGKPHNWVLSAAGNSWAYLSANGQVHVNLLRHTSKQKLIPESLFSIPKETRVLGISLENKKRPCIVCVDVRCFTLLNFPGALRSLEIPRTQLLRHSQDETLLSMVVISNARENAKLFICDKGKNLRLLEWRKPGAMFETIAENVVLLESLAHLGLYATYDEQESTCEIFWNLASARYSTRRLPLELNRAPSLFVYNLKNSWSKTTIGCLAYEYSSMVWRIICGSKTIELSVDRAIEIIGVIVPNSEEVVSSGFGNMNNPILIGFKNDRNQVVALWPEGEHEIITLFKRPQSSRVNPCKPNLHFIDEDGAFTTLNLLLGTIAIDPHFESAE